MESTVINVLLIEDNPGDQNLIQELLHEARKPRLRLDCVARLSTGQERLAENNFDVVLLDLSLPDSIGLETFLRLRKSAPQFPVIVLTGLDDGEIAVQAVREGAQDYLFKGYLNGDLLIRAIRYAIERKRIEETLRQRTVELQVRNAELDAFAHTVAHDLKNPLGSIVGFTDLLVRKHQLIPEEKRKQYLNHILQSGYKMRDIIEALLLLSQVRKQEVEVAPLDMEKIVSEVKQRLGPMVEEYQATLITPDDWPSVLGYTPWVEEVWANYINNALKYGGKPPRVELGATTNPNKTMIRFWVRDNGPGLTAEEQSQLFTPFTRLGQEDVEGHGLGLSIVQRIVEKLGGAVSIESQIGRGSTFSFTLPAVN